VFASADGTNMTELTDAGEVDGEPETFARNELVIVTKPGNPTGIAGLEDLAGAGVVSLCGEDVPCGRYAQEALDEAGVSVPESNVTRGQNVAATLTAVTEGDAVAAVVYATDAISAGDAVERVDIAAEHQVFATYPIGALAGAGDADLARAFVDHVLGPEGQAVLEDHGFLPAA
jgi:molybdate transport system substrate-binding protein